jgi:DNA-binding CsgD family transcriptional regulator
MPNNQRFRRDDTGRPHAAARGYCSRQWKLIRVLALIRDAWQCRQCRRVIANAREAHVDHIVSKREEEVLQLIAESRTNKEIATALGLSVYTVEAHRGRIMEKLNLHSIGELVRFAVRNGLID